MAPSLRSSFAVCLLALASDAAASPVAVLHDATIASDRTLVRGAEATVYVAVSGARSLTHSDPVAGASVELTLVAEKQAARRLATGKTDSSGNAVLRFRVPAIEPGSYHLRVATTSPNGRAVSERAVEVADKLLLHLRTDRGVYKPGGTVRWRVTALGGADAHPASGERVELVVRDPRETVVWRQELALSRTGMAAGDFPLGDDLVTGRYSLVARIRGIESRESIQVREVHLPAFEVRLERRPSAPGRFAGRVVARYRYGEPVRGEVRISTDRESGRLRGTLDAGGQLAFTLPLRDGDRLVKAVVTDGADRSQEASVEVPSRAGELRVALVPEATELVAGRMTALTVVTTDERGQLVPARISVRVPGRDRRIALDSKGAVRVRVRAPMAAGSWQPSVSAVAADGEVAQHRIDLRVALRGSSLHLRDAVVAAGQPVVVEGHWTAGVRGPVLVTLLRDGTPIASAATAIGPRGAVRAELRPPAGSFGLATVRLLAIGWDPKNGAPREAHHLNVYLRPAELAVAISGETRHRPGQPVELAVSVKDAAGRPVEGAGLAASVVDERVLALSVPRPDLVAALRDFDDVRDATALGLAFSDLLAAAAAPARDAALRAILEALPAAEHAPELVIPAEERYRAEQERIERAGRAAHRALVVTPGGIGVRAGTGWRYKSELWQLLAQARWKESDRITPWRQPTTWAYALELDPALAFEAVAPQVAAERLSGLVDALRRKKARALLVRRGSAGLRDLVARSRLAAHLAIDPWGTGIRVEQVGGRFNPLQTEVSLSVVSAGPDLRFDTDDDHRVEDVFADLGGFGYGSAGYGAGGGGMGGRSSSVPSVRIGSANLTGAAPLRARFDETVLWRVGATTSAAGRATLAFTLSDSITGWKVAVEAVSPAGAVGAATSRLETFLPLHLDAEVPARLAVGDRYRIPITIANHSGAKKTLEVGAELSGALRRAAGSSGHRLVLEHGASRVVFVRAFAHRAGTGLVRLQLTSDGHLVDRVLRRIPIEPRGELVRTIHAGEVKDGRGAIRFTVASDAAPHSASGLLRLYRGAADQALDGLEGMLQEPYGCFEQTSSATYPNLLVLRLLRGTPGAEGVSRRARDMVGRGYQRLISYEVSGGGFSWFGDAPANQVLTAYGLMEFVDMTEVYPVDRDLIKRTRTWLLDKQRADGSWKPDPSWLHDWSEVQGKVSTTAFVAWALAESGYRGAHLTRALDFLRRHEADLAADPYRLALWAAAETLVAGKKSGALSLLARRGARDRDALVFRAGKKTLFYATGESADAQVTALAASALYRAGRPDRARAALDWLWKVRSPNYGWGTTQSTVLALRAAALAAPKPAATEGSLAVRIDGRLAGRIDLAAPGVPSLDLPALAPGSHELVLEGSAAGVLRTDLRLKWRGAAAGPARADGLAVELDAPDRPIRIGGLVSLRATVRNPGSDPVAMPTVVLPVPPGFTVAAGAVRRLGAIAEVSKVEDHGDSLAVYLLELAPGQRVTLPYELDAQADCDVLQRPALAYAYYTPDRRGTSKALRLRANPTGASAQTLRTGAAVAAGPHEGVRHRSPSAAVWW